MFPVGEIVIADRRITVWVDAGRRFIKKEDVSSIDTAALTTEELVTLWSLIG